MRLFSCRVYVLSEYEEDAGWLNILFLNPELLSSILINTVLCHVTRKFSRHYFTRLTFGKGFWISF